MRTQKSSLLPPLGTKLLHWGGEIFIQLCASALNLVDKKGEGNTQTQVLWIYSAVNKVLHHVCLNYGISEFSFYSLHMLQIKHFAEMIM